jgi:hypothetical protein
MNLENDDDGELFMEHADATKWNPSVHYKHSLREVQTQLTPAEAYRLELAKKGRIRRKIYKLDKRVQKHPNKLNKAATVIQRHFRGQSTRDRVAAPLAEHKVYLRHERMKAYVKECVAQEKYEDALDAIHNAPIPGDSDLGLIEARIMFCGSMFQKCIQLTTEIIGKRFDATYSYIDISMFLDF